MKTKSKTATKPAAPETITFNVAQVRTMIANADKARAQDGASLGAERAICTGARSILGPKFTGVALETLARETYERAKETHSAGRASQMANMVRCAPHWPVIESTVAAFWRSHETGALRATTVMMSLMGQIARQDKCREDGGAKWHPLNAASVNILTKKALKAALDNVMAGGGKADKSFKTLSGRVTRAYQALLNEHGAKARSVIAALQAMEPKAKAKKKAK